MISDPVKLGWKGGREEVDPSLYIVTTIEGVRKGRRRG